MDQKSKWFGYLAKLAAVLVMCAAALAQSQANDAKAATQGQAGKPDNASSGDFQSPAVLKATTRLVIVDVVATDGKGVPIPGLTAKDFIVTENGSPQEVRVFSFESPETGPDAAMALTGQPVKFPDNVVSNIPDRKPRGALNVLFGFTEYHVEQPGICPAPDGQSAGQTSGRSSHRYLYAGAEIATASGLHHRSRSSKEYSCRTQEHKLCIP